jgi:hypothetical protein
MLGSADLKAKSRSLIALARPRSSKILEANKLRHRDLVGSDGTSADRSQVRLMMVKTCQVPTAIGDPLARAADLSANIRVSDVESFKIDSDDRGDTRSTPRSSRRYPSGFGFHPATELARRMVVLYASSSSLSSSDSSSSSSSSASSMLRSPPKNRTGEFFNVLVTYHSSRSRSRPLVSSARVPAFEGDGPCRYMLQGSAP